MKRTGLLLGLLGMCAFALSVHAQPGQGGDGPRVHYGKMWDAGTVETVKGVVTAVQEYVSGRGGKAHGLQVTVRTDKETISVILGPVSYLQEQSFSFEPQDALIVKGSRMSVQGQTLLIAAEVAKGGKTLKLRNEAGTPLWTVNK
jgi:hypothetical protein